MALEKEDKHFYLKVEIIQYGIKINIALLKMELQIISSMEHILCI